MMRENIAELSTFTCGFTFVFGGMIGCLTGAFCSDAALISLTDSFHCWCNIDPYGICFAAELLIAVFALLLSLAAFGAVLIPAIMLIFGYCIGILIFASVCTNFQNWWLICTAISFVPDVMIMMRIISRCTGISLALTYSWTSKGFRAFDLKSRLCWIWIDLVILLALYSLRRICF